MARMLGKCMTESTVSYKQLIVWQKSVELVTLVYQLTQEFPREEIYGLVSQMRRAAVSIPSNIAEGRSRGSKKEFRHFLSIAFGSCAELETQIEVAKKLTYLQHKRVQECSNLLTEIMKMLATLIKRVS